MRFSRGNFTMLPSFFFHNPPPRLHTPARQKRCDEYKREERCKHTTRLTVLSLPRRYVLKKHEWERERWNIIRRRAADEESGTFFMRVCGDGWKMMSESIFKRPQRTSQSWGTRSESTKLGYQNTNEEVKVRRLCGVACARFWTF